MDIPEEMVFDAQLDSLMRGAALNLSNMENLEWQTGRNWVEDGEFSGPVVNSRRQLWSVAGFLVVIGAVDYIYNFIQIDKQLKMTHLN